jgi:hypothetical protein
MTQPYWNRLSTLYNRTVVPRAHVPNGISPFTSEMAETIGVDTGCTHSRCFAFEAGRPFLFGLAGDYVNRL